MALSVTSPAATVKLVPVAMAVVPESLYHLIVPRAVSAAPVTSNPPLYTLAVNVVAIAVFLKILPPLDVITISIASDPAVPVVPCVPITFFAVVVGSPVV